MSKFSKIYLSVCIISYLLYLIYHFFCPYVLGQEIDREYLKNIDTEAITEFYRENPDAGWLVEKTGEITDHLSYDDKKNHVVVWIEIYPENIYKEITDIKVRWWWTKDLSTHDSTVEIKKNNIFIRITDETKTVRSKVGMEKLKELLAEIGL